jgi:adenylate cyclase
LFNFQFRAVIPSGPFLAGIVGIKKNVYDFWGDTVNIAARIEQTDLGEKVNISIKTCEFVKLRFQTEARGNCPPKTNATLKCILPFVLKINKFLSFVRYNL